MSRPEFKGKLLPTLLLIVILITFALAAKSGVLQSYVDFFIRGAHDSLESIFSWSAENFGSNTSAGIWRLLPFSLIYVVFTNILRLPSGVSQFIVCGLLFSSSFWAYRKIVPRLLSRFDVHPAAVSVTGLFYVFNTYTIIQLTNSFLLVIPYLVLPVQIWLLLQAFKTKKHAKYLVLLALVSAGTFGINLIFDVINLLVLLMVAIIHLYVVEHIQFRRILRFFGLTYGLALLLCSFWLVPQIYSSVTDSATANYVLHSEQFYNSDSSINHVLRGLGEWSFFSGQNNVPYNSFATPYQKNAFVIGAGYAILLIALLPMMLYRSDVKRRSTLIVLIAFLVILFAVIVGTYPGAPLAGLFNFAFKDVPFAEVFRNTYKFASVEMLILALLLAITLSAAFKRLAGKTYLKVALGGVFVVIVGINAFPFFTNQLYSKNIQVGKPPAYWQQTADYLNKRPDPGLNSIFMLPNQYFEALNWGGQLKTFSRNLEETLFRQSVVHNTCAGCGQFLTSNFVANTYQNLSKPGTFKLLGLTGNSTIVQRNDFASSYYNVQTPAQIKTLLAANKTVSKQASFGMLDVYQINKQYVNPLFYSPGKVVATDNLDNFATIADQNDKSTAISLTNTVKVTDSQTKSHSNYYQPVFAATHTAASAKTANSEVTIPKTGQYQLSSTTNDKNYRLSYSSINGDYSLTVERIKNQITVGNQQVMQSPDTVLTVDIGAVSTAPIIVQIQKHAYLLKPNQSTTELANLAFDPSDKTVQAYTTTQLGKSLVSNGSFEAGLWQKEVGDCAQSSAKPELSMKLQKGGAVEGMNSLLLSAKQDSACTYSPPLANFQPGTYYFSLNAKKVTGSAPSYCVWDGSQCVAYSDIAAGSQWTKYNQAVYLGNSASNFYLYLYAQKANYTLSQDQYDDVQVYRLVNPIKTLSYDLPASDDLPSVLQLAAGNQSFQTDLTLSKQNLIDNGNFNDGPWQSVIQNCTDQSGVQGLGLRAVHDSQQGSAIELSTTGTDTACTASAFINDYSRDSSYIAKFQYKILKGGHAKVCVWNGKRCVATKSLTTTDTSWHDVNLLVPAASGHYQPLSIYLYAPSGEATVVRYTGISIQRIENSFMDSYTLANVAKQLITPAAISFKRDNPTRYELGVITANDSLLVFSQSYHPSWHAYVVQQAPSGLWQNIRWSLGFWPRYRLRDSDHVVANGYANGWWFDPENVPKSMQNSTDGYRLVVDYGPQNLVAIGMIVSGGTLMISLMGVQIARRKRQRYRRGSNGIVYKDPAVHHGLIEKRLGRKTEERRDR